MVWYLYRHRRTEALPADSRNANQGKNRRVGGCEHSVATGNVGERLGPSNARRAEREDAADFGRTLTKGDAVGENGRTVAEVYRSGRSLYRRPGICSQNLSLSQGAISLFNAAHNLVEVAGQWDDCQLPVASFEGDACWALRTAHPHVVQRGDTTARCGHATGVGNTYLCVPILAQGEALGILHIQATDADSEMTEAEMSFHTTFAAQVGLSVANIRLREALKSSIRQRSADRVVQPPLPSGGT